LVDAKDAGAVIMLRDVRVGREREANSRSEQAASELAPGQGGGGDFDRGTDTRIGLHIVMLTCQFDEILGGAEKQCALLSKRLSDTGAHVVVLTSRLQWCAPGVEVRSPELVVRRFWTYAPPQLAGRYLPASYLWAVQVLGWIWRNRDGIDVLHVHQLRINAFVAAAARRILGIPCVMKLGLGGPQSDFFTIAQRKYLFGAAGKRFVVRAADRFVATTRTIVSDMISHGVLPDRITLIPNGVDFGSAETGSGFEDPGARKGAPIRFIFLGRLAPEKNIDLLLQAFGDLDPRLDVRLAVVGDGPLRAQADAIVARRGIGARIVFHGHVKHPLPILHSSDFLVLPSEREGLSNSLLEAMAHGVVPIVSAASGSRDLVTDGLNGFLILDVSRKTLAKAMTSAALLSDEVRAQLAQAAKGTVREQYSIEQVVSHYRHLYVQMAGGLRSSVKARAA
jgi:glycosyltransferase involved in cell wall biosynthesis